MPNITSSMEREQAAANSAILLTPRPSGAGSAVAVVRIRGSGVPEFLRRFFSRPPSPGVCVHGELRDGQSIIDDCLVVLDRGGNRADICLHGGAWVIESTLKLARRERFAIVEPALPIPDEALDEEVGVLEREVLQYLPLALTEPAIRVLLNQPAAWRGVIDPAAILKDMTLWRLLHPPKIAIVGEPNVGKSTLANRLFGQQRSITADVPGTTRDWVGEMADIGGLAAMLIDTPGIRETDDLIERGAIAAGGEKIREADLLIEVLDATGHGPRSIPNCGERKIVVINKIDQPPGWDAFVAGAVRISAKTGQGCDELGRAIHLRLGIGDMNADLPRWWTERQHELLLQAVKNPALTAKILAGE